MNISASTITGNKVRNQAGDNLGKIEDIMIDTASGQVTYAVLSFGGFLGIGDKYFAVPLQLMSLDTENKAFILSESKERLENAPGFDKDQWPAHSDTKWFDSVRAYYKVQ